MRLLSDLIESSLKRLLMLGLVSLTAPLEGFGLDVHCLYRLPPDLYASCCYVKDPIDWVPTL